MMEAIMSRKFKGYVHESEQAKHAGEIVTIVA